MTKGNGKDSGAKIIAFRRKPPTSHNNLQKPNPPFFNAGKIPPFTRALALLLLVIHAVLFIVLDSAARLEIFFTFGFVPGIFTGTVEAPSALSFLSPLTHILLHGGLMHLGFNLVMLVALGTFFERLYGPQKTALFIALTALGGAAMFAVFTPLVGVPLIGISGSISGFFAAFLLHNWKNGALGGGRHGPWPMLMFWVLFTICSALLTGDNVSWQAHLGGLLMGIFLMTDPARKWLRF